MNNTIPGVVYTWLRIGLCCAAGAMMVLALKLITAGVCYQDGLKKTEVRAV